MRRPGNPKGFETVPTLIPEGPRLKTGGGEDARGEVVAARYCQPAIGFVAHHQSANRFGQVINAHEFVRGKHSTCRIVRRIDDDEASLGSHQSFELVKVIAAAGVGSDFPERHITTDGT